MIIVSQKKNAIINFAKLMGLMINEKNSTFRIMTITDDMNMKIAEYKTLERAKEVLQDIATIQEFKSIGDYVAMTSDKIEFGNNVTNVYYMPEE